MAARRHKEAIHSGHFMVSNFEADEQDEEDLVGVPVPSEDANTEKVPDAAVQQKVQNQFKYVLRASVHFLCLQYVHHSSIVSANVSIDRNSKSEHNMRRYN